MASEEQRLRLDPGDGIPTNPSAQLPLIVETDNGWHELDPPEDEQPGQGRYLLDAPDLFATSTTIQQRFLQSCVADLGYSEDSRGRSKYGIWYGDQPSVRNSAFDKAAWCDMFLARKTYDLLGDAGLKTVGDYALTTAHARYLHEKGVTSRPSVFPTGAFIFQNWDLNGTGNGNLGRIDHVEVVERDNHNGTVTTVGGNVDNGVRRRTRAKAYCVVIAEWWKLPGLAVSAPSNDDWFME